MTNKWTLSQKAECPFCMSSYGVYDLYTLKKSSMMNWYIVLKNIVWKIPILLGII